MAKLTKQSNAAEIVWPGNELADKEVRQICRTLVREHGWRYSWAGGAGYPQLINPEGIRTYVPKTPSAHNYFERKVKRLGAALDGAVSRRSSFDGESLFSDQTDKPWTAQQWREQQRAAGGWRAELYGTPEPVKPEYAPLSSYAADVLAKVSRPQVRDDATGDGRWKLADARQMLRDGYSLDHVIERTGWGRMWLADLADRLAAG